MNHLMILLSKMIIRCYLTVILATLYRNKRKVKRDSKNYINILICLVAKLVLKCTNLERKYNHLKMEILKIKERS